MEQSADSAHHINEWTKTDEKDIAREKRRNSLVERLRAGNHAAAEELVEAHYEQIYLYMRRLGHDRKASEDLTQDCFLQAWQHIGQLKNDEALTGWLYRIASNVSKLYWRRHKFRELPSIENYDVSDNNISSERSGSYEQFELLKKAVSRLPRKFKETVVLHYMEHLTISQAAAAMGVREGTFKSRLNRALATLRKEMD